MNQDATWYENRRRPRPQCDTCGPSSPLPLQKRQSPQFSPMSIVAKQSSISATAEHLLYISPIWEEAPIEAIYIKNCVIGDVVDVITCTKFENEIFRGYDFTADQNFHFHIDF